MDKYVYCILDADKDFECESRGVGNADSDVHIVPYKELAAVVSEIDEDRLMPSRKNALAHELVLEEAMLEHTILPLSFGAVVHSEKDIATILESHYAEFT